MAPTPSPRPLPAPPTPRTPHSKQRLLFPTPKPSSAGPTEHPVEVIARIRDFPDGKSKPPSALDVPPDSRSIRLHTEIGYRDFTLDGVSISADESLDAFYNRFIQSRIEGVRAGDKCTIMMYGPTGSGKSHTMFGCAKQPGIVYRALSHILGDGAGLFVQVGVLEIFNEEIYDLLNERGVSSGTPKGGTPKVRLEVMGKKAKNATYISGNEAGKLSKEVARVEKRRIVKSTLCNERSSRSHCMIILDVPTVGGRLMLVDMAGSENIEQAGQVGLEAKMQTGKINQGNIALKRVVESIANGDSHVPFRDSKLTMLLQDSFEDDKAKILMILCASPDPKELHKTISTLEYGAKAKCIVRAAHMPTGKDKMSSDEATLLRSRITAMNQFIYKLQLDNKLKEKERDDAQKELLRREEELTQVRSKLKQVEGKGSVAKEEEINSKVDERTQMMRFELMKTEEMMLQQKEEISRLKRQLEELESDKSKAGKDASDDIDGGRFMKHLSEIYTGDHTMVVSMDLDMGDHQPSQVVKEIKEDQHQCEKIWNGSSNAHLSDGEDEVGAVMLRLPDNVCLSTVFEEDAEGEDRGSTDEDEVDKEVVEESIPHFTRKDSVINSDNFVNAPNYNKDGTTENEKDGTENPSMENEKDSLAFRKTRIQNIFRLCGNHRELSHQVKIPAPKKTEDANIQSSPQMDLRTISKAAEIPISASHEPFSSLHHADQLKSTVPPLFKNVCELHEESKENSRPGELEEDELVMIYVKWEASKDFSGSLIKKMKVRKDSTLSDLRKQIEDILDGDKQFTFLLLGDPTGAPLAKDKEATFQVSKLPSCSSQLNGHLACLRPIKKAMQQPDHVPFGSLENTLAKLAAF